jgi:hypothetical protein
MQALRSVEEEGVRTVGWRGPLQRRLWNNYIRLKGNQRLTANTESSRMSRGT